jgi:hypothetical protein
MSDPEWEAFKVRSRAADNAHETTGEPNPVVVRTLQGEPPHGDPTRWGGEARLPVHIEAGGTVNVVTPQIVRAQVTDHYARRWRWWLVLGVQVANPEEPGPNAISFGLEWTVGVGTITVVQRLDLIPFVGPITLAAGWQPAGLGSNYFEVPFHDAGDVTTIIGEAVSVRFFAQLENDSDAPIDVILTPKVLIAPEAISA